MKLKSLSCIVLSCCVLAQMQPVNIKAMQKNNSSIPAVTVTEDGNN